MNTVLNILSIVANGIKSKKFDEFLENLETRRDVSQAKRLLDLMVANKTISARR